MGRLVVERTSSCSPRNFLAECEICATAVITPARIAFGIFVGEHRALRLQHGARDNILRGNQFDLVLLAPQFLGDGASELRVGFGHPAGKKTFNYCGHAMLLHLTITSCALIGQLYQIWGERTTNRRTTHTEIFVIIKLTYVATQEKSRRHAH